MATWNIISFPDSSSPFMEQMIFFHDHTMIISLFIMTFVFYIISISMANKIFCTVILKNHLLELIWSMAPIVLLVFIAMPSLKILYQMEEVHNPLLTVKCFGHQWYWSYEYTNWKNIDFDSYMNTDLHNKSFRLLDVENKIVLPILCESRFLISSFDVIHSWTIPSLGVKVDAVPGRINQIFFSPYRYGTYFGQCSEICGANHSFMPISLNVTSLSNFNSWVMNN